MFTALAIVVLALCLLSSVQTQKVEQFHVHGPSDLNKLAVDTYLEERKKDPKADMGEDSIIMKRAKEYAIKRFSAKADHELKIKVSCIQLYSLYPKSLLRYFY